MYTLYDVFSYSNKTILESVGLQYLKLNLNSLRLILIDNLKQYNLLDDDSINIISNPKFYSLLMLSTNQLINLNNNHTNYNIDNMYELDLILIILNTQESLNLIGLYGSNYSQNLINSLKVEFLPELIEKIILNVNDPQMLIAYYKTSKYYREFVKNNIKTILNNIADNKEYSLNNESLIMGENPQIIKDLSNSLINPTSTIKDTPLPIIDRDSILEANISSINTFNKLFRFYIFDYYRFFYGNNSCAITNDIVICWSASLLANDIEVSKSLFEKLKRQGIGFYIDAHGAYIYGAINLHHILTLLEEFPILKEEENMISLVSSILQQKSLKCDQTFIETDSDILTNLLQQIYDKYDKGDDYQNVIKLLRSSINCPILFKLVFDVFKLSDNSEDVYDIIDIITNGGFFGEEDDGIIFTRDIDEVNNYYEDLLITMDEQTAINWIIDYIIHVSGFVLCSENDLTYDEDINIIRNTLSLIDKYHISKNIKYQFFFSLLKNPDIKQNIKQWLQTTYNLQLPSL